MRPVAWGLVTLASTDKLLNLLQAVEFFEEKRCELLLHILLRKRVFVNRHLRDQALFVGCSQLRRFGALGAVVFSHAQVVADGSVGKAAQEAGRNAQRFAEEFSRSHLVLVVGAVRSEAVVAGGLGIGDQLAGSAHLFDD